MSPRSAVARRLLRVPEITLYFWIIKGLSTAMGEATSDYLVHELHPVPAVLLGFVCFVAALSLQFSRRRYLAWTYWFAVFMVGVFGTMAADVLHVGFGVPYFASSTLYGVALAAVFATWQKSEKTLSIHSIDRSAARRSTGPRCGHLRPWYRRRRPTAATFHLGYLLSACSSPPDRDPRRRLLAIPLERDLRLLVCLRDHAPTGRLVCRLDGQAGKRRRTRLGRGTGEPGLCGHHCRAGRLPVRHAQGRAGKEASPGAACPTTSRAGQGHLPFPSPRRPRPCLAGVSCGRSLCRVRRGLPPGAAFGRRAVGGLWQRCPE